MKKFDFLKRARIWGNRYKKLSIIKTGNPHTIYLQTQDKQKIK